MTAVILLILTIVTLNYRNVIAVYTKMGGAYIVARDNFGPVTSVVAAVALMLDYIVTVAIQSAAGVAAIISTFPSLHPGKIYMTLGVILLLTYGNLRGVKEAGKSFAMPTYLFVGAMGVVFITGLYRVFTGNLPVLDTDLRERLQLDKHKDYSHLAPSLFCFGHLPMAAPHLLDLKQSPMALRSLKSQKMSTLVAP